VTDETNPDWEEPLAEVAAAVAGCLAALDRYEANFAAALAPHPVPAAPPLAGADPEWDRRLAAARDVANGLEHDLADTEAAWDRWRAAFSAWRTGIEQG
jgi:hypothetical protein